MCIIPSFLKQEFGSFGNIIKETSREDENTTKVKTPKILNRLL